MTIAELVATLARECPSGVSFDPTAVRLLRQKVAFEDWQIEELKAAMFQLGNGLWFSRDMISDYESRLVFEGQVMEWLRVYGFFSIERLFKNFRYELRCINTPEDCAAYLRHLNFTVATWKDGGHFCFLFPPNLDDRLEEFAETIAGWLEEMDGTLSINEIEQTMLHLTTEVLENIRVYYLPDIYKVEVGEVSCWRSIESITLPEDFSEKLTNIIDTLVALEEKISPAKLEFALNLVYGTHVRKEYILPSNDIFMRTCAKHYQGKNNVFPQFMKSRAKISNLSSHGRRIRSPNTRFNNLNIPIGAEIIFTKYQNISCVVLDGINQVKYDGKAWAISSLAMHLLGVSSANGFCHFSYDGETLWERRLRLEREKKQKNNNTNIPSSVKKETECKIVGLEGNIIAQTTWRAFKSDGTSPGVADWVRRIEKGETVEKIASESGYAVPTVKNMVSNYRLYFKVCEKNGIVPEVGTDV